MNRNYRGRYGKRLNKDDRILFSTPKLGRPKKFETVEELQEKIEAYFRSCSQLVTERVLVEEEQRDEEGIVVASAIYEDVPMTDANGDPVLEIIIPLTITGLACALDTTRETLLDYEKNPENAQFSDTIKKAKQIIHRYGEEYLLNGKNQTGAIFSLKNNWGWVDKTETDVNANVRNIDEEAVSKKADNILDND